MKLKMRKALTLKLFMTIVTLISTSIAILIIALFSVNNLNDMFQTMAKDKCKNIVHMVNLSIDIEKLEECIKENTGTSLYLSELQRTLYSAKINSELQYLYIVADAGSNVKYIIDGSEEVTSEDFFPYGTEESKEMYEDIDIAFSQGTEVYSSIYEIEGEETTESLLTVYMPLRGKSGEIIAVLGGDVNISKNIADIAQMKTQLTYSFIIIDMIAFAASFILFTLIFRPLRKIVNYIRELSKGDFTIEYNYNKDNEIGKIVQSLHYLRQSLKTLFSNVNNSSNIVQSAADVLDNNTNQIVLSINEVNAAVSDIAEAAGNQTAHTEMGIRNLENLNKIIESSFHSLNELAAAMEEVDASKEEGIGAIEILNQHSEESEDMLDKMDVEIQKTSASINEIGAASEAIKSIAAQTNLLALNASIESARAGEAGRGFSVVAEEIRKLSEESNLSASGISAVIHTLTANSQNMVDTMKRLQQIMGKQKESVTIAGDKFNQIRAAVEKTEELTDKLERFSSQMNQTKEELNQVFSKISDGVNGNADSTHKVSASMEEQIAILNEIADMSSKLKSEIKSLEDSLHRFVF